MDDACSLTIAYVSESYGPHDHRFLAAARNIAKDVWHVRLDPSAPVTDERPTPVGNERTRFISSKDFSSRIDSLRSVLLEITPDVVHAGPLQRVTFPVVLATEAPVLAASWGSDLLWSGSRDPVSRDVAAFVLSRASAFLGDCHAVLEAASELGYRGPHATIPWGIDVAHFCPDGPARRFGRPEDVLVLSTRNWEPVYAVETLAAAFAGLDPRSNMHLVLCGSGSEESRLRSILKEATQMGRVTWAGRTSQSDLPNLYRAADLYVSTSRCDGTSVSLLEAMGCGLPVLVSDIPSNREWVEDAELRFPVGHVEALKRSLRRMAACPVEQRRAWGQTGRSRVLRHADWAKAPEKLARLYRETAS